MKTAKSISEMSVATIVIHLFLIVAANLCFGVRSGTFSPLRVTGVLMIASLCPAAMQWAWNAFLIYSGQMPPVVDGDVDLPGYKNHSITYYAEESVLRPFRPELLLIAFIINIFLHSNAELASRIGHHALSLVLVMQAMVLIYMATLSLKAYKEGNGAAGRNATQSQQKAPEPPPAETAKTETKSRTVQIHMVLEWPCTQKDATDAFLTVYSQIEKAVKDSEAESN